MNVLDNILCRYQITTPKILLYLQDVLLEIPSVHISYLTISNVTKNSTFYCKSENSEGEASESIDIFVNRTFSFEVLINPEGKMTNI